jgi:hypothetical protein
MTEKSFIEHPPLPKIPKPLYRFWKKLKAGFLEFVKSIKLTAAAKKGIYVGLVFAIVMWLVRGMMTMVYGFLGGFIIGSIISSIVEAILKLKNLTRGQAIGIGIGFTLAFAAFVLLVMLTDIHLLDNTVYQSLLYLYNSIYTFIPSLLIILKTISKRASAVIAELIEELNLGTAERRQLLFDCLKKYGIMIGGAVLIAIVLYYASYDPSALTSKTTSYALMILVPLIISFFVFSPLIRAEESPYLMALGGGMFALFLALFMYYSTTWSMNTVYYGGFAIRLLLAAIFIVGLALFFKMFAGNLKKLTGWSGFFVNLLFFIPCLFSDAMQYLLQQVRITPNVVFMLFVVELILILAYLYIPKITQAITRTNSIVLLDRPMFLNREIPIGNSEMFLFKPIQDDTVVAGDLYRRNYAITMWVYVNPQPSSNASYVTDSNIFNYGDGKPGITYKNDSGNKRVADRDVYTIRFSDKSPDASYQINLKNQKWNFFAFNYFDSKVDLYINGTLERTFEFGENIPSYSPSDTVVIGDVNGLDGSICNVNYYKAPLADSKIATIYNLLSLKNPPTDIIE